jgi:phospholipid/cholesterol/gamma-HCH transport system substrate-binding protein
LDPERRLQIRTGFFTLGVLVALAAMVASLTREGGLFSPRYTLYADFNNIEGLLSNAPVHLAGNNIGRVRSIFFLPVGSPHQLRVKLDLDTSVRDRIRSDSVASIRTIGLLGDKYLEITTGTPSGRELADTEVLGTIEPVDYDVLAEKGGELLDNLVVLSASAERIVGVFEEAMGTESVASMLGSLRRITEEIETGEGMLHDLVYDESAAELDSSMRDLRVALQSVTRILREVETGSGPLHELIYSEEGQEPTLEAMRDSSVRLANILEKIDEGEGSLGALVNDPTLYEDIKLLVGGAKDSALLRTLIDYIRPEAGER